MKAKRIQVGRGRALALAVMVAIGTAMTLFRPVPDGEMKANSERAARRPSGGAQLVSVQALPAWADGEMCEWVPASASTAFAPFFPEPQEQDVPARQGQAPTPTAAEVATVNAREPVRMIKDGYPSYSSVAVDVKNGEVVMTLV